jgi:hypothetical protein
MNLYIFFELVVKDTNILFSTKLTRYVKTIRGNRYIDIDIGNDIDIIGI